MTAGALEINSLILKKPLLKLIKKNVFKNSIQFTGVNFS